MKDGFFSEADVVSTYTIDQATEDGILFDVRKLNKEWERGIFSHVTVNLLTNCGYFNEDETLNIPNLLDLLNQSLQIVRRESNNFTKEDYFFSGKVELPSGESREVFIALNELSKFTIMLPEDY